MRVAEALRLGRLRLERAGLSPEEALRETRFILASLLNLRPLDLYLFPEREVPEAAFLKALSARARGEPLAYILGEVNFYGRRFYVRPGVLIPRPETEILVEVFLEERLPPGPVLELGVGSGVIILTLLAERPTLKGVGVDISARALKLALENAGLHGLKERLFLVRGSWLGPLRPGPNFAALVSNPPYVSEAEWPALPREVREYEPREALLGGADGLLFIRKTLREGPAYLLPGGKIFLEIGYNQRDPVREICRNLGLEVYFRKDFSGIDRVAVVSP